MTVGAGRGAAVFECQYVFCLCAAPARAALIFKVNAKIYMKSNFLMYNSPMCDSVSIVGTKDLHDYKAGPVPSW